MTSTEPTPPTPAEQYVAHRVTAHLADTRAEQAAAERAAATLARTHKLPEAELELEVLQQVYARMTDEELVAAQADPARRRLARAELARRAELQAATDARLAAATPVLYRDDTTLRPVGAGLYEVVRDRQAAGRLVDVDGEWAGYTTTGTRVTEYRESADTAVSDLLRYLDQPLAQPKLGANPHADGGTRPTPRVPALAPVRHNHVTRDVKPVGQCSGCDNGRPRPEPTEPNLDNVADPDSLGAYGLEAPGACTCPRLARAHTEDECATAPERTPAQLADALQAVLTDALLDGNLHPQTAEQRDRLERAKAMARQLATHTRQAVPRPTADAPCTCSMSGPDHECPAHGECASYGHPCHCPAHPGVQR